MFSYIVNNDGVTKALFEHFRNMLTIAALATAAGWLVKRPAPDFTGYLVHIQGWGLAVIAVFLEWILVSNARIRMRNAGFGGAWERPMWVMHALVIFGGVLAYMTR